MWGALRWTVFASSQFSPLQKASTEVHLERWSILSWIHVRSSKRASERKLRRSEWVRESKESNKRINKQKEEVRLKQDIYVSKPHLSFGKASEPSLKSSVHEETHGGARISTPLSKLAWAPNAWNSGRHDVPWSSRMREVPVWVRMRRGSRPLVQALTKNSQVAIYSHVGFGVYTPFFHDTELTEIN